MLRRVLVANRGEIACRVIRTATELGIETVALSTLDEPAPRAGVLATSLVALEGRGAGAYLDIDGLIAVATANGCDAVHPGYGFLSESAPFAAACEAAGLTFVGPSSDVLARFGDKAAARALAMEHDVPVLPGSDPFADGAEAEAWVATHGPTMLKAVSGGGGRGMRAVNEGDDVAGVFTRAASEATAAFGDGAMYGERLLTDARHIEVQILGDGTGNVVALGDRDCSVQRQNQKIIELAPAPGLEDSTRDGLAQAATSMAQAVRYRGVGTFEFLLDRTTDDFFFIEANARLQVEHTVTEEVFGVDLVAAQFAVASGSTLGDLALETAPAPMGTAIQLRINTETMLDDATSKPTGGTITSLETPGGLGVRVETHAYVGYTTPPSFDSLLAKIVVHGRGDGIDGLTSVTARAEQALREFSVGGVKTNASFVAALLGRSEFVAGEISTSFLTNNIATLLDAATAHETTTNSATGDGPDANDGLAGAKIDASDPLAVLTHGKSDDRPLPAVAEDLSGEDGLLVGAPMQGTIVSLDVAEGAEVVAGAPLLVMEAMKMEHVIEAPASGVVRRVAVAPGDAVFEAATLIVIEEQQVDAAEIAAAAQIDLDVIRPDLAEVFARHGYGFDENRPEAVDRRHSRGKRTARENLAHLVDGDSFVEWGPLVVAAQRKRRSIEDLIEKTPGDGLVGGIGSVNGELFPEGVRRSERDTQCVVVTYDYMVLAGTQGSQNHRKKDRLFELARDLELPVILFAEGGGGRPGDTDGIGVAGLDCLAFALWGELSGHVPLIGINGGYCFAGNAALLGCCDVIIATEDSNVGMGGPAMIEGGGLGVYRPDEVGPVSEQVANGVIDILVKDEAEAVEVAKKYLSYFQGPTKDWETHDQRRLRHIVPENRLRIYDVREVIDTMFDVDSVLELRKGFGLGMITAFARIEGRPVGVIANNPIHLAGAIDSDGADKASRFMQLCDAFNIPIVFLCDTPGIMVGPEAEKTALVRHASRMFVTGAGLDVPVCTIVLRKGYGLGAQAMAAGGFKSNLFTVSWPTGEFGGMGLEGAVKLGYRNELAAIDDPAERLETFEQMVARMYQVGKGVSMADHFEIDDVIDPVTSRTWIRTVLVSAPEPAQNAGKKRPNVDTW